MFLKIYNSHISWSESICSIEHIVKNRYITTPGKESSGAVCCYLCMYSVIVILQE